MLCRATLEASPEPLNIRAYTDTSRLLDRGEVWKLCCDALAEQAPMITRELSRSVAIEKSMDAADPVLCKALSYRIVQSMTLKWKRKKIGSEGIRRGVRVWAPLRAERRVCRSTPLRTARIFRVTPPAK